MFAGNDLPGVMLSGGARGSPSLLRRAAPGRRAVRRHLGDRGLARAPAPARRRRRDRRRRRPAPEPHAAAQQLVGAGIEVLAGWTAVAARAPASGRALAPSRASRPARGPMPRRELRCDLLVVSGGDAPGDLAADRRPVRRRATTRARPLRARRAARDVARRRRGRGRGRLAGGRGSGELAACAPPPLGSATAASTRRGRRARAAAPRPQARERSRSPPPVGGEPRGGKSFACLCEDVTAKDIHRGVEEGYDSIELCQALHDGHDGPVPGPHVPALVGAADGPRDGRSRSARSARRPLARHGSTVPLGALAGAPVRARQAHRRCTVATAQLGGTIRWAGDWRRPYDYGDPEGEVAAVHEAAGLIDVSTLGKLLVRGPDAGEFLDRLYPNRLSNLKPGRIRYGVLTSDAGRIIDDGTVCRLDDDTFYVTTTSSGAGAVEQWFSWWLADWGLDVAADRRHPGACARSTSPARAPARSCGA